MPYSLIEKRIREHVWSQFNDAEAQVELERMGPHGVDWNARTRQSIEAILPRLPALAAQIQSSVPHKLNSARRTLDLIREGSGRFESEFSRNPDLQKWYRNLQAAANDATALIGNLESQQVSAEIQRQIASDCGIGDLVYENGNSIYPDLIFRSHGYADLPLQSRKQPVDGPCVQGKTNRRPSNVPDGCEIKTNRGHKIRVDAHGPHAGLHLGVTWELDGGAAFVTGVWIGYVRLADHRQSARNVKVTTVKYSFGHDLFESLL